MTIDRNTLVFFDSSCLIAAAGSPSGGSGFLLSLCARDFLKAAVSQSVLLEAQRNIQAKLGEGSIRRYFNLLAVVPFALASLPDREELKRLGIQALSPGDFIKGILPNHANYPSDKD
jgi:hypothetical protein